MSAFIGERRERVGVEPICLTSGVSAFVDLHRGISARLERPMAVEQLLARIHTVHKQNYEATATGAPGGHCDGQGLRAAACPSDETVGVASRVHLGP